MTGRREARRKQRREEIEAAALRIVRNEGLDALTMPGLARELGCAVGGLYRYFDGKEALLVALQIRALEAFDRTLESTLGACTSDAPLERLQAAMRSWGTFMVEEPSLYELLQLSVAHPAVLLSDEHAAEVEQHSQPLVQRCAGLLDAAVTAGNLQPGDAETRVWVLWGTVSGLAQLRKQDARRAPHLNADALVDLALETLLRGWS